MSVISIESEYFKRQRLDERHAAGLIEEIIAAQKADRARLAAFAVVRWKRGDWITIYGEERIRRFHARFGEYATRHERRVDQETLSMELFEAEKEYARASAIMRYLDECFWAYYVVHTTVTVNIASAKRSDVGPARIGHGARLWLAELFGASVVRDDVGEYTLVVDFALTHARRRAAALQLESGKLFSTLARASGGSRGSRGSSGSSGSSSSSSSSSPERLVTVERDHVASSTSTTTSLRRVPPKLVSVSSLGIRRSASGSDSDSGETLARSESARGPRADSLPTSGRIARSESATSLPRVGFIPVKLGRKESVSSSSASASGRRR